MPGFSANLGFLWQSLSFVERIHAAHKAGFVAVECHWPYDENVAEVSNALKLTGLPMIGINTLPGDLEIGEFGLCALPGREPEARVVIEQAYAYGREINAGSVHIMAGLSGDDPQAISTFVDNLLYANALAVENDMGVLIEPINRIDKPDYALHSINQALEIVEKIDERTTSSRVRIMYDCYHIARGGADPYAELQRCLEYVGHIQIASVPDRTEPDHGEIEYPAFFRFVDSLGYSGLIGAEYQPAMDTDSGLEWFQEHRR